MELKLPSVVIALVNGQLRITHSKTGMRTTVSPQQLDSWCLRQLRGELVRPAPKVNQ